MASTNSSARPTRRRNPRPARTAGTTSPAQANVVALSVAEPELLPLAMHRITARFEVDDWGRDPELVRILGGVAGLRWHPTVGGVRHLPAHAGALLVTNARRYALTPLLVAWSVGLATKRPVRFVGRPDVAPAGPLLRRLGGLLDQPLEVQAALRDGELVVVGTEPSRSSRQAGIVPVEHVGAALKAGVGIYPVAALSSPFMRRSRVEVGTLVRERLKRRGPLAEVELAEHAQHRLQQRLDEIGGLQGIEKFLDLRREG
ncbi:MAG: hypothetical protein IPM43_08425 [Actinomycetota bacterium]|nr:MAG: hypothetical protein IPM43_08425 [Actinomycetota bacterium]